MGVVNVLEYLPHLADNRGMKINRRISLHTFKIDGTTRAFPVIQPDNRIRPSTFNVVVGLPTKINDPRLSRH